MAAKAEFTTAYQTVRKHGTTARTTLDGGGLPQIHGFRLTFIMTSSGYDVTGTKGLTTFTKQCRLNYIYQTALRQSLG